MRGNIRLSEDHIDTQMAIILKLTEQGHAGMAAKARAILTAMHGRGFKRDQRPIEMRGKTKSWSMFGLSADADRSEHASP